MTSRRGRHAQVGLDRMVRLRWLDRTANLVLAGNREGDIEKTLQEELRGAFRSSKPGVRGSLSKTITILMKTWVRPPQELRLLQAAGLKHLASLPRADRIAVHWGMIMAVYPFWGAVAAHAGRLLRLQGTVSAGQVQRRIREEYGERETVSRRTRYVLRSYCDWGVLVETRKSGIYEPGKERTVATPEIAAWLAEALLHSDARGRIPLRELVESVALFPFRLGNLSGRQVASFSKEVDVMFHGMDTELLVLGDRR